MGWRAWAHIIIAGLLILPIFLMVDVAAQQAPAPAASNSSQATADHPALEKNPDIGSNTGVPSKRLTAFFDTHVPYEFWLTCVITAFGFLMALLLLLSMRTVAHRRPEDVSRPIIVVTLIVASLILITAGYSNEQIAPAFGLFGTIVGYILGRLSRTEAPNPDIAEPGPPGSPRSRTEPMQGETR